jgi:hypothetical protein
MATKACVPARQTHTYKVSRSDTGVDFSTLVTAGGCCGGVWGCWRWRMATRHAYLPTHTHTHTHPPACADQHFCCTCVPHTHTHTMECACREFDTSVDFTTRVTNMRPCVHTHNRTYTHKCRDVCRHVCREVRTLSHTRTHTHTHTQSVEKTTLVTIFRPSCRIFDTCVGLSITLEAWTILLA